MLVLVCWAGLCGALSGRVLDGVIVAACSSIASWSARAPCSTARITRTASTAHRHTTWLFRSVLLVVRLVIPTVSSATGRATRASAHAASTSVAVVATEESSGTTTSYLASSILTVIHLVLIHLSVVLHRGTTGSSSGWWTIVRLVSATSAGTEAALWRTLLLLLFNMRLLLLLLLRRRCLLLLSIDWTLLDVVILAILGLGTTTLASALLPPLAVTAAFLSGVRTPLHWFTLGTGYVGGFVTLLANDHIKLDHLSVANGTDGLFRVVASNG